MTKASTTRRAAALLLLLLPLLAATVAARVVVLPSGRLLLAENGRVTLAGINPNWTTPASSSWINATMTSDAEPSPDAVVATSSGLVDPAGGWKAFDHDGGTIVDFSSGLPSGYITYSFGEGATGTVTALKLQNVASYGVNAWTLAGSHNLSSYATLATGSAADTASVQSFGVATGTGYRYYRFSWTTAYSSTRQKIGEIQLWGTKP